MPAIDQIAQRERQRIGALGPGREALGPWSGGEGEIPGPRPAFGAASGEMTPDEVGARRGFCGFDRGADILEVDVTIESLAQ